MVVVQPLLDAGEDDFHDKVEHPVDHARDDVGKHAHLRGGDGLRLAEHLHDAQHERERGVLHQRDDLVAHGGQDALDHLGQHDLHERLEPRVAQHLGRLVLPARDRLDAAAVDLAEVGRVVDDEADGARPVLPIVAHLQAEQVVRAEHERHELQHEGRAAHHRDVEARNERDRLEPAHAPERHQHAQRQRADERGDEYLQSERQAREQKLHHGSEFHVRPFSNITGSSVILSRSSRT